jgi:Anti-sigma-K factor rskA
MKDELSEAKLEPALERLDAAAPDGRLSGDPEIAELEVAMTLLAHELEPIEPQEGARARLLAAAQASSAGKAKVLTFARAPRRVPLLPWALAAALAACVIGLFVLSGNLARLEARLDRQAAALAAAESTAFELDRIKADAQVNERRLDMITNVARRAYPLRAAGNADAPPVNGVVFVCGFHQQWLLSIDGLEPVDAEHDYRLWFITSEGPVDAGALPPARSGKIAMEDVKMPVGTRAFALTLEPKYSGKLNEPHGPMVLLGEQSVSL